MAHPHIILSTIQYARLKQKLKDYETKLSDIQSQKETEDKLQKETEDKSPKETEVKPPNLSSVSQSSEDNHSQDDVSISSQNVQLKNNQPQKFKKTDSAKGMKKSKKKIKRNHIIRMLSPPGDNDTGHARRDIKTRQIPIKNSNDRKKWISI
jgi:hypothetical protein